MGERSGTDPQQDPPLCEFWIEGEGYCDKEATTEIRPKNMITMSRFGRALMCDQHAHVCVEEAQGHREWEIESTLENRDEPKADLSVSSPFQRGPFLGVGRGVDKKEVEP